MIHTRTLHTQPQSQRDAINRLLERMDITRTEAANRIDTKRSALEAWFAGGPDLSPKQLERIVALTNPRGEKGQRRAWADAAEHRVLELINENPLTPEGQRVLRTLQLLIRAEELRKDLYKEALR